MPKFWLFFWAVADHWVVLVTGGVVTACLTVLQAWRGKPFSWRFNKWVLFAFIAFASFLAWRDEYERAQNLLEVKAELEGRLREREYREERIQALEAELRSAQRSFTTLQDSLKARRLSPEERKKFTDVLAAHDGQPFGPISVRAFPSCHECMAYVYDFVNAINSVPTWAATAGGNHTIKVDFSGIGIGIKDSRAMPPMAGIFVDALKAAALPFTVETLDFLEPDRCMIVVGNKP